MELFPPAINLQCRSIVVYQSPLEEASANGILNVSAQDKSTGKAKQITITDEKGRLSNSDIDHTIQEARKYASEDARQNARKSKSIDRRHPLEHFEIFLKYKK